MDMITEAIDVRPQPTLLGLPLELRERIYEYALQGDDEDGLHVVHHYAFSDPALCKVSKTVRQECRPIYYAACCLKTQTYVKCDSHGSVWLTTDKWYHALRPEQISMMRTFSVRFGFLERYFGEPVSIEFTVHLDKRKGSYSLRHSFGKCWFSDANRKGDPADCEEVLQILRRHLQASLAVSVDESGIGGFTAADIDRVVRVDPGRLS